MFVFELKPGWPGYPLVRPVGESAPLFVVPNWLVLPWLPNWFVLPVVLPRDAVFVLELPPEMPLVCELVPPTF